MLPIERELAVAIWALYSIDCVHWLKPGEVAFTRGRGKTWKNHPYREEAFTLLGRMPVIVNPLDLRPGLVVVSAAEESRTQARLEGAARRDLKRRFALVAISYIAAVNLLVLVPALLLKGWFEFAWKVPAASLLATHACILLEVLFGMRKWRRQAPGAFWPEFIALLLNPVGALRASDLFSKRLMATAPRS
jgi:hypothetical protein